MAAGHVQIVSVRELIENRARVNRPSPGSALPAAQRKSPGPRPGAFVWVQGSAGLEDLPVQLAHDLEGPEADRLLRRSEGEDRSGGCTGRGDREQAGVVGLRAVPAIAAFDAGAEVVGEGVLEAAANQIGRAHV